MEPPTTWDTAIMTFAEQPARWQASSDFASLATAEQGLLDAAELSRVR